MAKMFNRARMTITSTGTGALSLGVAVAGYQTFSSAGAQNGDSVSYAIEDGLKWEIGTGQYNSVAGTLSRTVTQSFDGTTYGTSAISVTTSAQVFISPLAADLQYGTSAGNLVQLDGSARLPAVDGSLVTALNASNIASGTIAAARVPTLNQNTTGTAAGLSSTLVVGSGGTGTGTAFTAGSVVFAGTSGVYSQANSQLFWDNTNNRLGVGTATPIAKIQLSAGAGLTSLALQRTNTNTTGNIGGIGFMNSVGNYVSAINSAGDGGNTGGVLIFNTMTASTAVNPYDVTERMRIDSSGNVGIGAAPTNYGGGYTGFWIQGSTGGVIDLSTAGTRVGTFLNTSTDVTIGSISTVPFIFKTSNIERMRIDASGNLGLGVSPTSGWVSGAKVLAFDTSNNGGVSGNQSAIWNFANSIRVSNNAYFNGTNWVYTVTGQPPTTYYQVGGSHIWQTAASGTASNTFTFTQAMTLDASGRLLINPTDSETYSARLSVVSATATQCTIQIRNPGHGTSQIGYAATGSNLKIYNCYSTGTLAGGAGIDIDQSGNLLVGTTTTDDNSRFSVRQTGNACTASFYGSAPGGSVLMRIGTGQTFANAIWFYTSYTQGTGGTQAGTININGSATTYGTSSDISLKENIIPANSSLASILSLPVDQFDWKSDSVHVDYGYVAQKVIDYAPEIVIKGDIYSVDYGRITPRLIKAFQELAAKVQALEAKVQ